MLRVGMMKEGKEENKVPGPMFPRLHINDTDKGGPRAPPRNKMALYEQLSIPSQRFSSGAATSVPLPPQSGSNQANTHERSMFSPFYLPSSPGQSAEKFHPHSSDVKNLKTTRMESENRSANNRSRNVTGSVGECSSLRPPNFSGVKNSCQEKLADEDDFTVPTFVQSENESYSNKDATVKTKRLEPFHAKSPRSSFSATPASSYQFKKSFNNALEHTDACDLRSREHEKNYGQQNHDDTGIVEEHWDNSIYQPEDRGKHTEPEDINAINDTEGTPLRSTGLHQLSPVNGVLDGHGSLNDMDVRGDISLRVRSDPCSVSLRKQTSVVATDNCIRESDEKASRPAEVGDADKNDEVSESSTVDSISGFEISPDHVVGVIGPKQFWKARRAIVHQQRVFSLQVFELHRLIKVQKLIAASPDILLEENPYTSLQKVPLKNVLTESNVKSQPLIAEDNTQNLKQNTDCWTEKTVHQLLTPCGNDPNRGNDQPSGYGPYTGNPAPAPLLPDNKSIPWCFHPPGNQWLVPVMSPSEGLIYKPYTGPYPPTAGFMSPFYGSCPPSAIPPFTGYGVSPSHQQQNMGVLPGSGIPPNYFTTPYGLPPANLNPVISSSAVEQVSPMTGARRNWQTEQHSRSSCNMSNARSEAFSGNPRKFRASKESGLHGSTASSPSERAQGDGKDALALFAGAPIVEDGSAQPSPSPSGGKVLQNRVIKVVPHNARSATESAARIFRSIQEERQQLD